VRIVVLAKAFLQDITIGIYTLAIFLIILFLYFSSLRQLKHTAFIAQQNFNLIHRKVLSTTLIKNHHATNYHP